MVKIVWGLAVAAVCGGFLLEVRVLDAVVWGVAAACWVVLLCVHPKRLNEAGLDRQPEDEGISAVDFDTMQSRWFLGLALTGFLALLDLVFINYY